MEKEKGQPYWTAPYNLELLLNYGLERIKILLPTKLSALSV